METDKKVTKATTAKKTTQKKAKPQASPFAQLKLSPIPSGQRTVKTSAGDYELICHLTYDEIVSLGIHVAERCIVADDTGNLTSASVSTDLEIMIGLIEGYTNIQVNSEDRLSEYISLVRLGVRNEILEVVDGDEIAFYKAYVNRLIEGSIARINHRNSIDHFVSQLSSGSQAGEQLLDMIDGASINQNALGEKIAAKYAEVGAGKKPSNILNFSARKDQ